MDIPIKIINLATAISWAFLIIFSVTAVYSVKDLEFNLGTPQMEIASDGKILLSLSIEIANKGYYNIGMFDIKTKVLDHSGSVITEGSTLIPTIERDERLAILHNVTLDVGHLLQLSASYLFTDTQLNAVESVSMRLGGVIPVEASGNLSIPWGAPLANLKVGEPQYAMLNSTHTQVTLPISFDNHASIDIVGEAQTRMYNSTNGFIGFGQIEVEASQHSHYDEHAIFCVAISSVTRNGWIELRFHTQLFSHGPIVIPYG